MGANKMEMKAGEKYLSIKLLGNIQLAAFKNKNKENNPKAPDYKGDGIAIWVTEKKAKDTQPNDIQEEDVI